MAKHIVNSVRYFYVLSIVILPVLVVQNTGSPTKGSTIRPVVTTADATEHAASASFSATSSEISGTKLTEQESTELSTSDLQSTKASVTEWEILSTNEQDQEKSTVAKDFTSEPDQEISTVTEATTSDEVSTMKENATTSKLTSVESDTDSITKLQTVASTDSVTIGTEEVVDRIATSFFDTTMTTKMVDQTTEPVVMPTSTFLPIDLGSDIVVTTFGAESSASDVVITEVEVDVGDATESNAFTTEKTIVTESVTARTEEVTDRVVTTFLGITMATQKADQTTVSVVMPTSSYLTSDLGSDRVATTFGPEPSGSDVMTTKVDITVNVDDAKESIVAMTTEVSMITDSVATGINEVTERIVTSFLGTTMPTQMADQTTMSVVMPTSSYLESDRMDRITEPPSTDVFVTTDMSMTTESDSDAMTSFIGRTTEHSVVTTTDNDYDSISGGITTSVGTITTQETLTTRDGGVIKSQSVMITALPVDITTNISITSEPDDVRMTSVTPPQIVSTFSPEDTTESDSLTLTSSNLPTGPTSSVTLHSVTEHVTQSEQRTTQLKTTKTQTPIQSTKRKPGISIDPDKLNKEVKSNCVVNAEVKSIRKEDWPDFKFREFVAALEIATPTRRRRKASNVNSNITADDVKYVKPTPQQIGDDLEIQFVVSSGSSYVQGSALTDQLNKSRKQIKSEVGIELGALSVGIPEVKKPSTGENSSSSNKKSDIFVAVITIACVSLVMLSAGLIYIVCDRRRARRGEFITESTVEEDGGYDNPIMNEKKGTNGNGAHLMSMKVDTAMVPMEEQANGDQGKFEVEDTHL